MMPANRDAAALTEAYRRRMLRLRDATSRQLARRLQGIDLDADDLDRELSSWTDDATVTVENAQQVASRETGGYLAAYLQASGVDAEWDGPDPDEHAGRDAFGERLDRSLRSATVAMLWRLGRGEGRDMAMASGLDRAARVTRTSVMHAGRETMRQGMQRESSVGGWRRVTAGEPCGACLAQAGVLIDDPADLIEFHDHCRCTSEPQVRGVRERVRRPTGDELLARMSESEQARLFAGRGGAAKAKRVREVGVDKLVARGTDGRIVEAPLEQL